MLRPEVAAAISNIFLTASTEPDPSFRKYFYEELLHEFRRDGQTIIAATHDDHYFQHADRILKMEFGQFEDATASFA